MSVYSGSDYTESNCYDQKQAIVHLFEWHWDWIADECEKVLGPKGFCGVQVSPPMEHIQGGQWWTRYQPVSYKIESRSGNRGQFESMVQRCNSAGVIVIVDAVINLIARSTTTAILMRFETAILLVSTTLMVANSMCGKRSPVTTMT